VKDAAVVQAGWVQALGFKHAGVIGRVFVWAILFYALDFCCR
jgi:hypothetical protein